MPMHSPINTKALYIERLQQAVRVMEGLSNAERANFDIDVIAIRDKRGVCACIAGFCGLDPWFQTQGFTTHVGDDKSLTRGHVSIPLEMFFGTDQPFFRPCYGPELRDQYISVNHAIAALRKAIALFDVSSNAEARAACTPTAA